MKELIQIQSQLNAPKGQYNSFGKYKYRSCEDILGAVKPLLNKLNCTLIISDDVVMVGARIYIKATATITNSAGEKEITTAFAREEDNKKGMDGSQVTGAASSYARKYALNGLFAIDDTKDADALNNGQQQQQQPQNDYDPAEIFEAYAKPTIEQARTKDELTRLWTEFSVLQTYPDFVSALTARRKALGIKKVNEK